MLAAGANSKKQSHRKYGSCRKEVFFLCSMNSFCTNPCYFNGIWALHTSLLLKYNHDLREIQWEQKSKTGPSVCVNVEYNEKILVRTIYRGLSHSKSVHRYDTKIYILNGKAYIYIFVLYGSDFLKLHIVMQVRFCLQKTFGNKMLAKIRSTCTCAGSLGYTACREE